MIMGREALKLMKKISFLFFIAGIMLLGAGDAQAEFTVNWGNSWDPGDGPGYDYLANWLVNKGYYSDVGVARTFTQTGYIGYGVSDADPFSFDPGEYELEIVLEIAGYSNFNTLGYYNGSGNVEVFSGPEGSDPYGNSTGSKTVDIGDSFGLYMYSQYNSGTYWYTDRSLNTSQSGQYAVNVGGDAQALIYELNEGEWLVAWEDLDATRPFKYVNGAPYTDNDYNDMFVILKSGTITNIVPEPATILMFSSFLTGLFGIGLYRRRG